VSEDAEEVVTNCWLGFILGACALYLVVEAVRAVFF
jgi:hypothetical protein